MSVICIRRSLVGENEFRKRSRWNWRKKKRWEKLATGRANREGVGNGGESQSTAVEREVALGCVTLYDANFVHSRVPLPAQYVNVESPGWYLLPGCCWYSTAHHRCQGHVTGSTAFYRVENWATSTGDIRTEWKVTF